MRTRAFSSPVTLAALAVLAAAPAARAEGWGTIKGQVVWAGGNVPAREELKVDKDQEACLAHGPLLSEKYVVDPKTKGVRWVVVWLADPNNPRATPPIKPELKEIKPKRVVVDQPTCQFEPHVLALREGQVLDVRNPAKVAHNVLVTSAGAGPNLNQIVPPGKDLEIPDFKAGRTASNIVCSIHGWMKGYVWTFNHPYFAVTDEHGNFEIKDAPAGTWNLVLWQEEKGWVTAGLRKGVPITVPAGGTADLGKIELKP